MRVSGPRRWVGMTIDSIRAFSDRWHLGPGAGWPPGEAVAIVVALSDCQKSSGAETELIRAEQRGYDDVTRELKSSINPEPHLRS